MGESRTNVRVILLTNFVPPYRIPVFQELQRRVGQLRVLISTPMEGDRPWNPGDGGLDVVAQRSLSLKAWWKQPKGFKERIYVHFPYDTLAQLIRYRPDVIISAEFGFRTLNAVLYRILFRKSRLIVWGTLSQETERYRSKPRVALRSVIVRFTDAIFTNGRSGIRYLQRFSISPDRLFIIPQAIDMQPFIAISGRRKGAAVHRMLFSGRLVARKQLGPFIDVLNDWCSSNPSRKVEIWVVGDGPERKTLEAMPLAKNLEVRFLGGVNYNGLPAIYAQCGALVIPTLADEWALVVNEGLASGMPVLGSVYSQAVQDLIVDGENGWVYCIDNIDNVKSAVAKFLTADEATLNTMSERAKDSISAVTPQLVVDKILHVMDFVRGEKS